MVYVSGVSCAFFWIAHEREFPPPIAATCRLGTELFQYVLGKNK